MKVSFQRILGQLAQPAERQQQNVTWIGHSLMEAYWRTQ